MTDTVRCPACRGAKKVPKLGGMIGECNTCSGKGTILAADKPVSINAIVCPEIAAKVEILNAVADCVPASTVESVTVNESVAKKNIYRKKKA